PMSSATVKMRGSSVEPAPASGLFSEASISAGDKAALLWQPSPVATTSIASNRAGGSQRRPHEVCNRPHICIEIVAAPSPYNKAPRPAWTPRRTATVIAAGRNATSLPYLAAPGRLRVDAEIAKAPGSRILTVDVPVDLIVREDMAVRTARPRWQQRIDHA